MPRSRPRVRSAQFGRLGGAARALQHHGQVVRRKKAATPRHGAGLLLRQAVRDWLAAADAQTLEDHLTGADEPAEEGSAPSDDDDGPGDGGSPVLSPA
mgnify:CR=1 FL=1